jgi:hypothetical protein
MFHDKIIFIERTGIQAKHSEKRGRNGVDNCVTADPFPQRKTKKIITVYELNRKYSLRIKGSYSERTH